jgi:excisionase family DNA binding protein
MTTRVSPRLLTPQEVASLFRVDPKTVTRWARAGRLRYIRTAGGHRRYYAEEVEAMLTPEQLPYQPIIYQGPPR